MTITATTQKAYDKAAQVKCKVRILPERRYLVTTPEDHNYVVRMQEQDGVRVAICHCAAGSLDKACYHIVYAAGVDDLTSYGQKKAA